MINAKSKIPYAYRQESSIPDFPDDRPLFIFDGVCVLCSGAVARFARHDKNDNFRFATMQSPLGQAIYKFYGIDPNETYLLIDKGLVYGKSDGYLHMTDTLGGAWGLLKVFYILPRPVRNYCYDIVARNRYQWFGKVGYCEHIDEKTKSKMI